MWKIIGVLTAYHIIVGCLVMTVLKTEKQLTYVQRVEWAIAWPIVVGANVYMQDRWMEVIADVEKTLDELNSGRWERK